MKKLPKRDVNKLVHCLQKQVGVEAAVLYGSVARGDYGPKSDIDIFIVVRNSRDIRVVQDSLAELELTRRVQPMVRTRKQLEETDFGLLRKIFQEGLVLFAVGPFDMPAAGFLHIRPYILFTFELTDIPQKEKARFNRLLYQSKQYADSDSGLLGAVGGHKLAKGCVLVPVKGRQNLERLLKRFKVKAEAIEVWK